LERDHADRSTGIVTDATPRPPQPPSKGSPRARPAIAAAAAILVLALVALIVFARRGERPADGSAGSTVTAAASVPSSTTPRSGRQGSLRLRGVPLQKGTGLSLLVADAPAPFVLDLDRETAERVTGLPTNGERGVTVLPVGKDALVLSERYCGRCGNYSAYLLRHGSTAATPLGRAREVVPHRDGNGLWMLTQHRSGCVIHRVDPEGRPLDQPRRVRCGTGLVADLQGGLLLSYTGPLGSDAHNALLEPDGDIVRLPYQDAQPVVGNLVLTGADRHTPLVLHDVKSGASHRLSWPSKMVGLGDVSGQPNGPLATVDFARYLPRHRFDLWLLDTRTRRWRHLPGMPAHVVPKTTDVEWTSDGGVVLLARDVLAVWRPGETRLAVGRVKPPKEPGIKFMIW
jgi:hypothetical protein